MKRTIISTTATALPRLCFLLVASFGIDQPALAAPTVSEKMPVVSRWNPFEHSLRSSRSYDNPLQDVTLAVTFISPSGQTNTVDAFWDGARTWRVRFSPDHAGVWQFSTACSDETNRGLHNQSGKFICTASRGKTRFDLHGPVRVARSGRHLEHADGTPFLWLADTAWNGALLASPADWEFYAGARASQKFTAAQWVASPGADFRQQAAFTGTDVISINPDFFRRMDAKVDTLNRAGLLNAIVPLWDIESQGSHPLETLPEEQVVRLLKYMLARWGANDVAWLLTCETDPQGERAKQWKRISESVFANRTDQFVVIHPAETYWALQHFVHDQWADVFGYQSGQAVTDDTIQWIIAGPFSQAWRQRPYRPYINLAPAYENGLADRAESPTTSDTVRRVLYWSLLAVPPAGVSYGGQGVWNWNNFNGAGNGPDSSGLPIWKKALFMPAAKQITLLSDFLHEHDFWRLRPAPHLVVNQPGFKSPTRYVAAARTEERDLTIIYVPEDRTIELRLEALPPSPSVGWINPRTGERSPAVAVVGGSTCQFPTPDVGDWLLVMKTQEKQPASE